MFKKIKAWFHKHRHHFWPWEYMDRVPSIHGGSTGFAVSVCGVRGCGCVAVMPRVNLTENASSRFRKEFMEALEKNGQKLVD